MGKSGKNKKAQASKMRTQFPAMSDDDLLDQAVSENKAAAALAKTEVDMGNMGDECPTKQELLAVLDNIILFDLRSGEPGKGGQPCISSAGDWVFYCDENDAIAAMEAHKDENPGALVAVGCTPLGRAFALSEGKAFGFQSSMAHPMRIQGSTAVLEAIGEADAKLLCPQALAQQMNEKTSTIPMFSLEELHEPSMLPFFFTRIDMIDYWTCAQLPRPRSHSHSLSHSHPVSHPVCMPHSMPKMLECPNRVALLAACPQWLAHSPSPQILASPMPLSLSILSCIPLSILSCIPLSILSCIPLSILSTARATACGSHGVAVQRQASPRARYPRSS